MSYIFLSDSLDRAFLGLNNENVKLDKPLKISTMTLQFQTSEFGDFEGVFSNAAPESKKFRNCVTTKLEKTVDHGNVCLKVFTNRSIFVAGCTNIMMAVGHVNQIFPKAVLTTVVIHLINICFRFSWNVNMLTTFQALQQRECFVSYDTSVHAAINIKFNKTKICGTILLYRTGSIVMAGFKDPNHIVLAFTFLKSLFAQVPDASMERVMEVKVMRKRGRKKNATKEAFYDYLLNV